MQQNKNIPKVSVLGDANVDMILNLSNKNQLGDPQLFSGGSTANVASGLSRLNVPVSFFGSLGNDMYGKFVINDMQSDGIDTSNVQLLDDYSTAMVIGVVEENSDRHFFIWPPENGAHNQFEINDDMIENLLDSEWLHVSGIGLRFRPLQETMLEAMKNFRENNKTVSFDLNLRTELWGLKKEFKEVVLKAISYSSYIFGNLHEELLVLFKGGLSSLHNHFEDDQKIICRNGKQGAIGIAKSKQIFSQAFPVAPIDSVGAGDAFNTGFIFSALVGDTFESSLEKGNLHAAYKLLGHGARHLPNNEQLRKFSTQFK